MVRQPLLLKSKRCRQAKAGLNPESVRLQHLWMLRLGYYKDTNMAVLSTPLKRLRPVSLSSTTFPSCVTYFPVSASPILRPPRPVLFMSSTTELNTLPT